MKGALATIALWAGVAVPARAQCPDGTPPPCARASLARANTNSVAVLYFDNLSRDTNYTYLADGLTEEVIATLGKVRRLDVKSLYASQQFRGRGATSPAAVGRALGATYLLRGSVRPAGGRVRVTYEVVRAASGAHVAGDLLDRSSTELAGVPGDLADAAASAILGSLRPEERASLARRPTQSADAHDLYLRALHAADSWSQQGPQVATALLDRAIALDSGFALAYAAKAMAATMLADGYELPRQAYARSREAANDALRLDSSLALAWAILGTATLSLDYDFPVTLTQAQRAQALDPRLNWGFTVAGVGRLGQGRLDEGITLLRHGWELDTLDAAAAGMLLWALYSKEWPDSMARYLPRMHGALDRESENGYRGMILFARHDYAGAAALLDWHYYGGWVAGQYVHALLALGRRDAALATVDSMIAARSTGYYNPVALARAYAALGDRDRAFEWLERGYEERTAWVGWSKIDLELAPLRDDPRYAAFTARMRY